MTPTASDPEKAKGESSFGANWLLAILLVLVVAALYANSLHGEWVYDDYTDILGPEAIRDLWPMSQHFATWAGDQLTTRARPLASLTFALNATFGGDNPTVYHLTNVAIHLLATLSLFDLVRQVLHYRVGVPGRSAALSAFWVALLWGVHPLQTEAVAYITQRYESLMGLFVLLVFLCLTRSLRSPHPGWWEATAAGCSLLAMASKEVAVVLPVLLLLFDRTFLAGSFSGAWRARRTFHLASGMIWTLFLWNQIHVDHRAFAGFDLAVSWHQYAANQPSVILHYLRLVLWPDPLVLDYGWQAATSLAQLLPGLLVIGVLLAITLLALVKHPRCGFLGGAFFALLAPTSSVMPLADLAVEHRMYLPLAPVLILLVLGWDSLFHSMARRVPRWTSPLRVTSIVLGGMALTMLCCLTFLRNEDYRTALGLSLDTVTKRPDNARAHMNYAFALNRNGAQDQVLRHARIAARLAPDNALIHTTLAAFLDIRGMSAEAILELERACRLDPQDPKPWMILGAIHSRRVELPQAAFCYTKALALNPRQPQLHCDLGQVNTGLGKFEAAVENFRAAIQLEPGASQAHHGSALALLKLGRLPEALQGFEDFVRSEPRTSGALAAAGQALYAYGSVPEATCYWRRALSHDPGHLASLLSLSWALSTHPKAEFRNGKEALALAEQALKVSRERSAPVLDVLGAAYAEIGRFSEACLVTEEAIGRLEKINSSTVQAFKTRLALYRKSRPFRHSPTP